MRRFGDPVYYVTEDGTTILFRRDDVGAKGVVSTTRTPATTGGATGPNAVMDGPSTIHAHVAQKRGEVSENVFRWNTERGHGHHMRPTVEMYDDERLTQQDRAVFMALSYNQTKCAPGTLVTWPTRDTIADLTALFLAEPLSTKQVATCEHHLCRYGWMDVIPWRDKKIGFMDSATYVLWPRNGEEYEVAELSKLRGGGEPDPTRPTNHGIERESLGANWVGA